MHNVLESNRIIQLVVKPYVLKYLTLERELPECELVSYMWENMHYMLSLLISEPGNPPERLRGGGATRISLNPLITIGVIVPNRLVTTSSMQKDFTISFVLDIYGNMLRHACLKLFTLEDTSLAICLYLFTAFKLISLNIPIMSITNFITFIPRDTMVTGLSSH